MPTVKEPFLWHLLQAVAAAEPHALYPARFAQAANIDRDMLDDGLDELRRRGVVELTEWVKDFGQGCALTEAGRRAIADQSLPPRAVAAPGSEAGARSIDSAYERGEIVRGAFLDPCTPYVTRILLVANLVYFAVGAICAAQIPGGSVGDYLQGRSETTNMVLQKLGALHPALVFRDLIHPGERPQFERIILSCFLHIGLLHLAMNMYFLGTLGRLVEAMWGPVRFLLIYFIATIVSGCVVLMVALFWPTTAGLTAGASGALFGIFASFLVWFLLNQQHLPREFVRSWSRNIGINLILLTAINFVPGVSWQGHLGGAIGGFLAALVLHVQRFSPYRALRIMALMATPAIPVAFFVALLWQAGWF